MAIFAKLVPNECIKERHPVLIQLTATETEIETD